ncbi:hypothetical protein T4A_10389 [Trichinella pseudospiralis]|uniref:Uncharacterized protein n=1 Tax=Trichinella pseudospiralis TaxID=6337 RepID=A0A0V1EX59_TRIPS|nr:hypothetical protein T4A_10389 [Trichinella pseudospiralis]
MAKLEQSDAEGHLRPIKSQKYRELTARARRKEELPTGGWFTAAPAPRLQKHVLKHAERALPC